MRPVYQFNNLEDASNDLNDKQIKLFLHETFPNYPLNNLPAPSQLERGILATNRGKITGAVVLKAAACLHIPKDMRYLAILPEFLSIGIGET